MVNANTLVISIGPITTGVVSDGKTRAPFVCSGHSWEGWGFDKAGGVLVTERCRRCGAVRPIETVN
jgi:hypothetical protein